MPNTTGAAGFNATYAQTLNSAIIDGGLEIYKAVYFPVGAPAAVPAFGPTGLIDPTPGANPTPVPVNAEGNLDYTMDTYLDGSPCDIRAAMTAPGKAKWVPIAPLIAAISPTDGSVNVTAVQAAFDAA